MLAFCIHTHTRPHHPHTHAHTTHTRPHHPHTQSQYSYAGPAPKFFEECETYWAPSSQANELYEQLATRKYREILREQIQYEEILLASIITRLLKGGYRMLQACTQWGGVCYNHHGNVCIMKSYCSPGSPSS